MNHLRSVHDIKKAFACNKCYYSADEQEDLDKHIAIVHEKKRLKKKIKQVTLLKSFSYILKFFF